MTLSFIILVIGLGPRSNVQNSHHLVVLVGEDMTVPDVAPWLFESGFDAGDLPWQGGDHVLGSILYISSGSRDKGAISIRRVGRMDDLETVPQEAVMLDDRLCDKVDAVISGCNAIWDKTICVGVAVEDNLLAIDDLEVDQVQVDGMAIAGHIPDLPLLGCT